jgi:hypothetical protein
LVARLGTIGDVVGGNLPREAALDRIEQASHDSLVESPQTRPRGSLAFPIDHNIERLTRNRLVYSMAEGAGSMTALQSMAGLEQRIRRLEDCVEISELMRRHRTQQSHRAIASSGSMTHDPTKQAVSR